MNIKEKILSEYLNLLKNITFQQALNETYNIPNLLSNLLVIVSKRTHTVVNNFDVFCETYKQPINYVTHRLRKIVNRPVILNRGALKINNIGKEETLLAFEEHFKKYITCPNCSSKDTHIIKEFSQFRFMCSACHYVSFLSL